MVNTPTDLYADTAPRIEKTLELYRKEFGRMPTRIVLHTALWDAQRRMQLARISSGVADSDLDFGKKMIF